MDEITSKIVEFHTFMTFYVQIIALTSMRFWGIFFIFPIFVWAGVPPVITMVSAFCLSLPALPGMVDVLLETNFTIWPITSTHLEYKEFLTVIERKQTTIIGLKEFMLGAMLGFFPATFFYGFITAGEMIDQARGDIGGRSASGGNLQMTNCGQIFFLTGSSIFFASGDAIQFIRLIYHSYEVWPIFEISSFVTPERIYFFLELSLMMLFSMVKVGLPFLVIMWSIDIQTAYQTKTDKKFQAQEYQHAIKNFIFISFFIIYLTISDNEQYNPTVSISSTFSAILEGGMSPDLKDG